MTTSPPTPTWLFSRLIFLLTITLCVKGNALSADDPDRGSQQPRPSSEEGASTLGGKQFWADVWFYDQWRIQRNVLTGHYRLLDEENRRHTWGTLDRCLATFDENRRQRRLPPMRGKAVG